MSRKKAEADNTLCLESILSRWTGNLESLFLIVVILSCGLVIGLRIADPQSASPNELGIPTFLLCAIAAPLVISIPWSRLGIRIRKIGWLEFEQVVLSQKKEQAELLDSLSQQVEKLEVGIQGIPIPPAPRQQKELDNLLLKFFTKYPKMAFSPWRIQNWEDEREEFKRLRQYSNVTIRHHLDRHLVKGLLRTALRKNGNTLYMLAYGEKESPNNALDRDEE